MKWPHQQPVTSLHTELPEAGDVRRRRRAVRTAIAMDECHIQFGHFLVTSLHHAVTSPRIGSPESGLSTTSERNCSDASSKSAHKLSMLACWRNDGKHPVLQRRITGRPGSIFDSGQKMSAYVTHKNLAVRKRMEAMRAAHAKSGTRSQYVSNYTWGERSLNIGESLKGKRASFA